MVFGPYGRSNVNVAKVSTIISIICGNIYSSKRRRDKMAHSTSYGRAAVATSTIAEVARVPCLDVPRNHAYLSLYRSPIV